MALEDGQVAPRWGFRVALRRGTMALAVLVWCAALLDGGAGSNWDVSLYRQLYAGEPVLARNAALFTQAGGWIVLTALTAIAFIFLAFRRRRRAALLLILVFGGRLMVELQKLLVGRPRPGVSPHLEAVVSQSFPSGHAANAMITYLAIALLVPVRQRNRAIAVGIGIAIALQVGWSRVALGVHWPSDVIGGWAFGAFWVILIMRLASARPDADPGGTGR